MNILYPPKGSYPIPKKNVLVISCIDLRLTDNLLDFLNAENLQNRYDHFALAGASLVCTKKHEHLFEDNHYGKHEHWNKCLDDHLEIAVALHHVKDVYIVEHQDCGAYKTFLKEETDMSSLDDEKMWHRKFAEELAERIHGKVRSEKTVDENDQVIKKDYQLNVHCFFIDLRGNVEVLSPALIHQPS
jgi:carbonic anhydrase